MYKTISEPFEITIKSNGKTFSAVLNWDTDATGVIQALYGLMVAATWQPESIKESMLSFIEEDGNYIKSTDVEEDWVPKWKLDKETLDKIDL